MSARSKVQESALTRVKHVFDNRSERARELAKSGKKIIGYQCCYVPAEIITAAGAVPFRITGDINQPTTKVDVFLETQMCPHVRSSLEMAVQGCYDFIDGMIIPHTCDAVQRIYGYWKQYVKPGYLHHLEVPHVLGAAAVCFFRKEMQDFKDSLQEWTGVKITEEALRKAIKLHNENRTLVKALYDLRKSQPPLISGSEVLQVLVAGLSLPVEEFNLLLINVIKDAKQRKPSISSDAARIMIYGCVIDNLPLIELVEKSGAAVVMDDLAIGTRSFWFHVKETGDPLEEIAKAYLMGIRCPRTIVGEKTTPYKEEVEHRFRYLVDYGQEFKAQGVLLYILQFCDPHQFDVPDLNDYLRSAGLKTLIIDDDYRAGSLARIKTRVEAFVEMIKAEVKA